MNNIKDQYTNPNPINDSNQLQSNLPEEIEIDYDNLTQCYSAIHNSPLYIEDERTVPNILDTASSFYKLLQTCRKRMIQDQILVGLVDIYRVDTLGVPPFTEEIRGLRRLIVSRFPKVVIKRSEDQDTDEPDIRDHSEDTNTIYISSERVEQYEKLLEMRKDILKDIEDQNSVIAAGERHNPPYMKVIKKARLSSKNRLAELDELLLICKTLIFIIIYRETVNYIRTCVSNQWQQTPESLIVPWRKLDAPDKEAGEWAEYKLIGGTIKSGTTDPLQPGCTLLYRYIGEINDQPESYTVVEREVYSRILYGWDGDLIQLINAKAPLPGPYIRLSSGIVMLDPSHRPRDCIIMLGPGYRPRDCFNSLEEAEEARSRAL